MKRNRINNQSGFTAIEIILVLVILAGISFIGYRAFSNHTKAAHIASVGTPVAKIDPTAGWKTYISSYQNISFKYPPNWSAVVTADGMSDDNAAKEVSLMAPNGFSLTYDDEVSGIGGACTQGTPDVILTGVTPVVDAHSTSSLYIIESGDEIGLESDYPAPKVGDIGTCLVYPLISGSKSGTEIGFTTNVEFHAGTPETVPGNQAEDLVTAKLILSTFKYN